MGYVRDKKASIVCISLSLKTICKYLCIWIFFLLHGWWFSTDLSYVLPTFRLGLICPRMCDLLLKYIVIYVTKNEKLLFFWDTSARTAKMYILNVLPWYEENLPANGAVLMLISKNLHKKSGEVSIKTPVSSSLTFRRISTQLLKLSIVATKLSPPSRNLGSTPAVLSLFHVRCVKCYPKREAYWGETNKAIVNL